MIAGLRGRTQAADRLLACILVEIGKRRPRPSSRPPQPTKDRMVAFRVAGLAARARRRSGRRRRRCPSSLRIIERARSAGRRTSAQIESTAADFLHAPSGSRKKKQKIIFRFTPSRPGSATTAGRRIAVRLLALRASYRLRDGGDLDHDTECDLRRLYTQRRRQLAELARRYGADL